MTELQELMVMLINTVKTEGSATINEFTHLTSQCIFIMRHLGYQCDYLEESNQYKFTNTGKTMSERDSKLHMITNQIQNKGIARVSYAFLDGISLREELVEMGFTIKDFPERELCFIQRGENNV